MADNIPAADVLVWTRPGETLLSIRTPDAGICAGAGCRKPLTEGMFHWADIPVDPDSVGLFAGDGRFPALRHADGSPDCGQVMGAVRVCPQCKSEELTERDTGYGTVLACVPCGWNQYTDRGD